jgi:hypothetical protein
MKAQIRELLEAGRVPKAATPGGYARKFNDSESRDTRGMLTGDTYQRYCQRCKSQGIEPRDFREWLHFELAIDKPGRHRYLDDVQRVEAMQLQA